jgi:hypothetical protein
MKCLDQAYSSFDVSIFNALTTKCLFHETLRFANANTRLSVETDPFLVASLSNPERDADGKKYTVTVKYSGCSSGEPVEIFWNNSYSPHSFFYSGKESFGSINFFAL